MSPTGISAKRAPGTSTNSTSLTWEAGGVFVAADGVCTSAREGFSDCSAPAVLATEERFAAGDFADAALAGTFVEEALALDAAGDSAVAGDVSGRADSSRGASTVGSEALRASGKNRSTGRDGAAPFPCAAAELGMRAPRPLPRPLRFSLIDSSLRWNSRARTCPDCCCVSRILTFSDFGCGFHVGQRAAR